MKTLLFCPLFIDGPERLERNLRWLRYYGRDPGLLGYPDILMVDNASSMKWLDSISGEVKNLTIMSMHNHLPKVEPQGYGYWYRAHGYAASFAIKMGYDKIIHIDSDAYVLTRKLFSHLLDISEGWHGLWCPKYSFPEVNIQVICRDYFEEMHEFHTENFLSYYPYEKAEDKIPFTHVNKDFVGDRYGESDILQKPAMDYYCQATNHVKLRFEMEKE